MGGILRVIKLVLSINRQVGFNSNNPTIEDTEPSILDNVLMKAFEKSEYIEDRLVEPRTV